MRVFAPLALTTAAMSVPLPLTLQQPLMSAVLAHREGAPRSVWLTALLRAWAAPWLAREVLLLRQQHDGSFAVEGASGESLLWAELLRCPERWDGGVAGEGPAAQALQQWAPVQMQVSDPRFRPWRDAARRDRLAQLEAWPLECVTGARVLLLGRGADRADGAGGVNASAQAAALYRLGRLLDRDDAEMAVDA